MDELTFKASVIISMVLFLSIFTVSLCAYNAYVDGTSIRFEMDNNTRLATDNLNKISANVNVMQSENNNLKVNLTICEIARDYYKIQLIKNNISAIDWEQGKYGN